MDGQKRVLGLSFGKKLSNCELLVKEALLKCQEQGMEIQFIRVDDLNIHPCTGCTGCVVQRASCRGSGRCIHSAKDDFPVLEEAVFAADAVIVACPAFVLGPTGHFKTVVDRFGPSHDITFAIPAIEVGQKEGRDPSTYPDVRILKKRVAALISVGGAQTENWLSQNLPGMYGFVEPMGMDVVDKYEYFAAMDWDSCLGRPEVMERMGVLGQNIVDALNAGTEEGRTRYRSERLGVCPVCHEKQVTITGKGNIVECPICGIEGTLDVVDGEIVVTFSEEQQKRSRLKEAGKWEHSNEIRNGAMNQKKVPNLAELKKKYIGVGEN